MKKLFFIFIFTTLTILNGFSQSEKEMKSNIRSQNSSIGTNNNSRITSTEFNQKQNIRVESQTPRTTINPNIVHYPVWNSWNRWGAPYNFWRFDEFYTFDRFGYRTPTRIYYQRDNTKDTVESKKKKIRLGLNFSTDNQIGGWITVGRAIYFKGQFQKILVYDRSEFFTHPDVNFYNATSLWQDQRLDDITKGWSLYLGVGRELKNIGVNLSLGIGNEQQNYQFFDEYYQLSNNGKYSFKNFVDNYVTFSLGVTHDYKFLSLSADFDPLRKTLFVGAGFNF